LLLFIWKILIKFLTQFSRNYIFLACRYDYAKAIEPGFEVLRNIQYNWIMHRM